MYMVLYNQTFSAGNTAACFVDAACDYRLSACKGVVVCDGKNPGAVPCCVANPGLINPNDLSASRLSKNIAAPGQQYFVTDGTPCYFKKGQAKKTYFNVCQSHCMPWFIATLPPTTSRRLREEV
jgi:hypothetical protein